MSSITVMTDYINTPIFKSENEVRHSCRAKYFTDPTTGESKLLSIQSFSMPFFIEQGYELCDRAVNPPKKSKSEDNLTPDEDTRQQYIKRAVRRAKINCFDIIQCNPDLNAFATMTISPEVADRESWDECYRLMRVWLSNRVQRKGLKYICVPEHHHDGKSIHFHALFNRDALNFSRAYNPSGRPISHNRKAVYNLDDVDFGFTTMQLIDGENATDKVSKYIFKYMGKQLGDGARIGGRYFLHGGKLLLPSYKYADEIEALIPEGIEPTHIKECEITNNLKYKELYFI